MPRGRTSWNFENCNTKFLEGGGGGATGDGIGGEESSNGGNRCCCCKVNRPNVKIGSRSRTCSCRLFRLPYPTLSSRNQSKQSLVSCWTTLAPPDGCHTSLQIRKLAKQGQLCPTIFYIEKY